MDEDSTAKLMLFCDFPEVSGANGFPEAVDGCIPKFDHIRLILFINMVCNDQREVFNDLTHHNIKFKFGGFFNQGKSKKSVR